MLDRIDSLTSSVPLLALGLRLAGARRMKGLAVLGSTGTIGEATLDVAGRHPGPLPRRRARRALESRSAVRAGRAPPPATTPRSPTARPRRGSRSASRPQACRRACSRGPDALAAVATLPEADVVMAAIVGAAGSPRRCCGRGRRQAAPAREQGGAGARRQRCCSTRARRSGATILPIDSEHNAIFQCLPAGSRGGLAAGRRRRASCSRHRAAPSCARAARSSPR